MINLKVSSRALGSDLALKAAERKIQAGFSSKQDIIETCVETLEEAAEVEAGGVDEDENSIATDEGSRCLSAAAKLNLATDLVIRLWDERLQEQNHWPADTDADKLERAFQALRRSKLFASMDYTCCSTCGHSEMLAEWQDDDNEEGYVFFHEQNMDSMIATGRLYLHFGSFSRSPQKKKSIGKKIVRALKRQGLTVKWSQHPNESIEVHPINWLKRLPADAEDVMGD